MLPVHKPHKLTKRQNCKVGSLHGNKRKKFSLVIPSWMQIYEKRIKFFIVITGLDLSRALVASEAFPLLASRKKGEKKKKSHLSSSLSFSLCSLRASSSARLYAVFKRSLLILLLDPLLRFQAFLSPKTRTLDTKAYFTYPFVFWGYKYY